MNIQVLLGTLLGDGNIYKNKRGYYYFSVEHSSFQEEYINWKSEHLKIDNIYKRDRLDKRTNKIYSSITLCKTSEVFKVFHEAFYTVKGHSKAKKVITQDILNELTPEGIAVWYCDDGNMYYNGNNCHLTLSTNGFSDQSIDVIIQWFKKEYNFDFKKTVQKAIRLTKKQECQRFISLIKDYIPPCMNYKELDRQIEKHERRKETKKVLFG